jgi:hypothetical protein
MDYLFLDTGIYLNCALMREPREDSDLLLKLSELLTSTDTSLLVPAVVELEFDRFSANYSSTSRAR